LIAPARTVNDVVWLFAPREGGECLFLVLSSTGPLSSAPCGASRPSPCLRPPAVDRGELRPLGVWSSFLVLAPYILYEHGSPSLPSSVRLSRIFLLPSSVRFGSDLPRVCSVPSSHDVPHSLSILFPLPAPRVFRTRTGRFGRFPFTAPTLSTRAHQRCARPRSLLLRRLCFTLRCPRTSRL